MVQSIYLLFKNIISSTSHKKNSGFPTVHLSRILAKIFFGIYETFLMLFIGMLTLWVVLKYALRGYWRSHKVNILFGK
jgi:hypothetical protein